jgi:hypothetical protein
MHRPDVPERLCADLAFLVRLQYLIRPTGFDGVLAAKEVSQHQNK